MFKSKWSACIFIVVYIGRPATGELFNFDVTSMRTDEPCDWGRPASLRRPDELFCASQTHLSLDASADNAGEDPGTSKTKLIKDIEAIRKTSPNRALSIILQEDLSFVNASILAPIGPQIVALTLLQMHHPDLTSRLPAIDLSNLLDLRFWDCNTPGLNLHKADFSGMQNIRSIEFKATPLVSVEPGMFTDLPALQTLALGNDLPSWDPERAAVWLRLKCDGKNAWLWEWLKEKPTIQNTRESGQIFRLGNFTSDFLEVEPPGLECTGSGTRLEATVVVDG